MIGPGRLRCGRRGQRPSARAGGGEAGQPPPATVPPRQHVRCPRPQEGCVLCESQSSSSWRKKIVPGSSVCASWRGPLPPAGRPPLQRQAPARQHDSTCREATIIVNSRPPLCSLRRQRVRLLPLPPRAQRPGLGRPGSLDGPGSVVTGTKAAGGAQRPTLKAGEAACRQGPSSRAAPPWVVGI